MSPGEALGGRDPGRASAARTPGRPLLLLLAAVLLCSGAGHPPAARADAAAPATAVQARGALDGLHLVLGPVGSAIRLGGRWDGGFGGALSLIRVRERASLAALGLGLGGLRLAREDRGLLWADLQVGSRRLTGVLLGLSAGVSAEVGEVISTRWGGHATLWVFAGVVPYARIGAVQKSGTYVDFGIQVALPTFRF